MERTVGVTSATTAVATAAVGDDVAAVDGVWKTTADVTSATTDNATAAAGNDVVATVGDGVFAISDVAIATVVDDVAVGGVWRKTADTTFVTTDVATVAVDEEVGDGV